MSIDVCFQEIVFLLKILNTHQILRKIVEKLNCKNEK